MGWRSVSMRAVVLIAVLLPAGAAKAQDASQLPDDPSKDVLLKNCIDCHNIDVVIGKHQNSADWKSTIARMSGYGINMPADEIDRLTDYLARVQGLSPSRPPRP
jgi:cytochrome c5